MLTACLQTDNGNPVIDAPLPHEVDVTQLCAVLGGTPGVVGHGLFLIQADVVLIEDEKGHRVSAHSAQTDLV